MNPLRLLTRLCVTALLIAPIALSLNQYYMHVLNSAWIFAIAALGLSIATGVGGQIVLGQAALFGFGSYATALLMLKASLPWWLALPATVVLAGLVGIGLGRLSTRIKGHYLAITTLALNEIFRLVVLNEEWLTGGPLGLRIPQLHIPFLGSNVDAQFYPPLVVIMLAAYALAIWLHRSRIGRDIRAVRDDELGAAAMGVNSIRTKTIAFVACSVFAALAGGLYVMLVGFIAPTNFTIAESIRILLMVVLGGLGSIPGTMLGAFIVTVLPEALRDLQTYYMAAFGLGVVLILLVWPRGLGVFADWLVGTFWSGRPVETAKEPAGPLSLAAAAQRSTDTGSNTVRALGEPLMILENVNKRFGGISAMTDVSFAVHSGEIIGVIGPNGSGKSTMVNACSGTTGVEGSIIFDGHHIENLRPWDIHAYGVARIFQNVRLWDSMTVIENVMVAYRPKVWPGEEKAREAALQALEQMGVAHLANRNAKDLSFGQSRLVEMARAVVSKPKLLLLDEPAAGLRGGLILELAEILKALSRQGMTILVIEHRIKLIMSMCDRVVVLNLSELIAEGDPATVMNSPRVVEAYLGEKVDIPEHSGEDHPRGVIQHAPLETVREK